MVSLLIVGQPRGLTSHIYRMSSRRTPLRRPAVHNGEVLNSDQKRCRIKSGPQYTREEVYYERHRDELMQYAGDAGFCIKDVVQPYSVLRFVREHPGLFRVLHVYRDPAECRACQRARGWREVDPTGYLPEFWGFKTVRYDELVRRPSHLWDALESLGYEVDRIDYRTRGFRRKTAQVEKKIRETTEN